MLWGIATGLLFIFAILFFCSFTLGEWIFLLPLAAVPLAISRFGKQEPEAESYRKWKRAQALRGR